MVTIVMMMMVVVVVVGVGGECRWSGEAGNVVWVGVIYEILACHAP